MDTISTNKTYQIEAPAQLKAIASAVRQDILDHLESAGPSSVSELSRAVGLAADALYYHVNILVGVGLLVEQGTRKSDRRDETVFALPAKRIQLAYKPSNVEQADAVKKIVGSMLRTAARDFDTGMGSDEAVAQGSNRNLWGARLKGWLTPDQLAEVNQHLERLHALFHTSGPSSDATLCALTWSMAPVDAQPVRRPTKESPPPRKKSE